MTGLIKIVALGLLAAFTGIYSATVVHDGRLDAVSRSIGNWKHWPAAGARRMDPYTRARLDSEQRLPLSKFETLELSTDVDLEGDPISADCNYRISGTLPPVRRWHLSAHSVNSGGSAERPENSQLSSSQVTKTGETGVNLVLSRNIVAGNWLQPVGTNDQRLVLRLFAPVFGAGRDALDKSPLSVELIDCQ